MNVSLSEATVYNSTIKSPVCNLRSEKPSLKRLPLYISLEQNTENLYSRLIPHVACVRSYFTVNPVLFYVFCAAWYIDHFKISLTYHPIVFRSWHQWNGKRFSVMTMRETAATGIPLPFAKLI